MMKVRLEIRRFLAPLLLAVGACASPDADSALDVYSPGGGEGMEEATFVAADSDGNLVATGAFSADIDLGGGLRAVDRLTLFVVGLDAEGRYRWDYTVTPSSALADEFHQGGVVIDAGGDVFVAGRLLFPIDFGGGNRDGDNRQSFIVKLDRDGSYLGDVVVPGQTYAESLSIDGDGNVYLLGRFYFAVDFGGGVRQSDSTGTEFVLKLDSDLDYVWDFVGGSNGMSFGAMAVAADGQVTFAGGTDPCPTEPESLFLQLDRDGQLLRCQAMPDPPLRASALALTSTGAVIVADWSSHTVSALAPTGESLWTRFVVAEISTLEPGADGAVLASGYNGGTDPCDPESGSLNPYDERAFVMKLDATGDCVWSHGVGAAGDIARSHANDAVSTAHGTWIVGAFTDTAEFASGSMTSTWGPDGPHRDRSQDLFVERIDAR